MTPAVSTAASAKRDSCGRHGLGARPWLTHPAPPTGPGRPFPKGTRVQVCRACLPASSSVSADVLRFGQHLHSLIHAKKISYTVGGAAARTRPLRRRSRVSRTRDSPHCSKRRPAAPVPEPPNPQYPCPVPALFQAERAERTTESLHLSSLSLSQLLVGPAWLGAQQEGDSQCVDHGRSGGHCIPRSQRTLRMSRCPGGKVLPAEAALVSFLTRSPHPVGASTPDPGLGCA